MTSREWGNAPNNFWQRLHSFRNVKLQQKYAILAKAGYRYIPRKKYAICHCCYGRDFNFLSNRDPEISHIKNTPNCWVLRRNRDLEYIHNVFENQYEEFESQLFICKICTNRKVSHFFFPCFHAPTCEICSRNLTHCPFCEREILRRRKIYYQGSSF